MSNGNRFGLTVHRMSGRDPGESGRTATPLELLYDLTFVVAFGIVASQFALALGHGHLHAALAGFALAMFQVCWAWINFSWFASAYDNDDLVFRLSTMVQMCGIIILAIGVPRMYESIVNSHRVDNHLMVAGYIVIRIAMLQQWMRAARRDPVHRRACLAYAAAITVAQIGWIAILFGHFDLGPALVLVTAMIAVEMMGPLVAQRKLGGTPWHAHHIAERYGLIAIIALGEGVFGASTSLEAALTEHGWTVDSVLIIVVGLALTFGMWWMYFLFPAGPLLEHFRERSFVFGYGHIVVLAAIVATGAGLELAAEHIGHETALSRTATVLAVAIPVAIYIVSIALVYWILARFVRPAGALVVLGALAVIGMAVGLSASGLDLTACLLVVAMGPVIIVVGTEVITRMRERRGIRLGGLPPGYGPSDG